jgi:hypothetical protein
VAKKSQEWRDKLSGKEKKEYYKLKHQALREKKKKIASDSLPQEDQINFWVTNILNLNTKRHDERKSLCRESLKEKCRAAKEKFPDLIFYFVKGVSKQRLWLASLDRIDSNLGYTDDNVQVIPLWLNLAKSDSTQDEIDDILYSYVTSLPKFKRLLKLSE